MRSTVLPIAVAVLIAPHVASAQRGYTVTINTSERWMNARQRPGLTRHVTFADRFRVDSVAGAGAAGSRTLFVSMDYPVIRGVYAHDAAGRPLRVEATVVPRPRDRYETAHDSAELVRLELMEGNRESLALPAARLWGLVPTFPDHPPVRGERWSDTLVLEARHAGFRQALSGRRVSRVVKDTLVDGRRLWIVRDSAAVRYAEVVPRFERTLDTLVTVERTARGTIVGRHLYDPTLRLFTRRSDTTALAGEAVLRYPDGRAFRSPTRFERVHDWAVYDAAELARHRQAQADSAEAAGGAGPVRVSAAGSIEERLRRGDRRLRDSLMTVWRRSRDPEARRSVVILLDDYADMPAGELAAAALQAGDTAYAVEEAARHFHTTLREPMTEAQLRLLLPFMDDPGRAFALGIDPGPLYENARQGLLASPPSVTPDSSRWACTRAACALLALQRTAAREPRLRDLGVVAALAFDPPRWADTVRARVAAGSVLLRAADEMVRGLAPTGRSAPRPPLPGPGAEWRAWLAWMRGRDPTRAALPREAMGQLELAEWQATVLRFHRALTGRDVAGELLRKRAEATEDSARLVYGTILLGMGERLRTPAELAAAIRSGTPTDRELALREMSALFSPGAEAPPAVAAAIADIVRAMAAKRTEGTDFRVQPVLQVGPFVRVSVDWRVGGVTAWLMETEGGWVIVDEAEWVT